MIKDDCLEFVQEYNKLKIAEKETFSEAIQRLLSVNYILCSQNRELYYFILKNHEVINYYFKFIDYSLVLKEEVQIAYITTQNSKNRIDFNKLETVITLIIRLLYQEKMSLVNLAEYPQTTLGELHSRINNYVNEAVKKDRLTQTELKPILKKLRKYNIIGYTGIDYNDDEKVIVIYPTIEMVLDYKELYEIKERLDSLNGGTANEDD